MFSNPYARQRGATIQIFAKDWNEWVLKGKDIAHYPPGRQIVIPRIDNSAERISSTTQVCTDQDIPEEHRKLSFDWFPEEIRELVIQAIFDPNVASLFLHGLPGRGKSALAAATAIKVRDCTQEEHPDSREARERAARFVSQAEFVQCAGDTTFLGDDTPFESTGMWDGATHASWYVNQVALFNGVLVLDDVIHQKSPPKLAEKVIEIINSRHGDRLKTLITSNLSPAEVAAKLDPAVASRLCGGLVLHVGGEDLRQPGNTKRSQL